VELDDSFNSIVGYIGEGYYAYMIDAEGAHVNPQIAGPAATVPCTGPLVVTAVSDPPTWVHIGTPPVPIGPSLAFSEQVTNVFDIADTVWNSGGSQSANATVRYVLSRNGKAQDFTIGTRSVLPLAPGQSNSGVTRVSVGSNVTAGFYYVLACVETKCKTSSDVGLVVDFASAIKDSVGPTITVLDANGVGIRTSFVDGIRTSFVPNFLLTPKQAAELGGYDHFNWLNLAVDDPLYDNEFFRFAAHLPVGPLAGSFTEDGTIPRAPYVDPPAGGWLYQVWNCRSLGVTGFPIQDHYAWYFDEVFDDCRVQTDKGKTDIAFRTSDDEVKFVDYPRSFIGYPVTFNTYLGDLRKRSYCVRVGMRIST